MTERIMTCVLLRHGKTKGNLEKRYIGCRTDEPLCEQGIAELVRTAEAVSKDLAGDTAEGKVSDPVFVSPMARAGQTADIFFPAYEKTVIPELTETDFGRFEGKNYKELSGDPDYQAWIDSGGTAAFPEGEAPDDFRRRSYEGFEKAVRLSAEKDCDRLWIVAHGGTVMSVMSRLSGKEYFDFMANCGEGYELKVAVTENGLQLIFCRPYPPDRLHTEG